jgi:hypothetical protein
VTHLDLTSYHHNREHKEQYSLGIDFRHVHALFDWTRTGVTIPQIDSAVKWRHFVVTESVSLLARKHVMCHTRWRSFTPETDRVVFLILGSTVQCVNKSILLKNAYVYVLYCTIQYYTRRRRARHECQSVVERCRRQSSILNIKLT